MLTAVLSFTCVLSAADLARAQTASQPAAKATVKAGDLNVLRGPTTSGASEGEWQTIMSSSIKTSNQKDLLVGVSLECSLFTRTLSKSKNATSDTSSADASVQVRVLVDGRAAEPGQVVFARRTQELTATFQGILDGCLSIDPLTGEIVLDEACVQPESLELLLDTMNAASFNFVLADVGTGVHRVEVQARVDLGASSEQGSAESRAAIGKGSFSVEEIRLVRGEDVAAF